MLLALSLLVALDSAVVRTVTTAPAESIRVTITGTGTPVVIIPGLSGRAFAFRKVIPAAGRERAAAHCDQATRDRAIPRGRARRITRSPHRQTVSRR
jgi:hypothetical protein